MLNRLNDYSKLSFRLFFKNKLISTIVLVILLVVSVFTITVMNILFSYIDIGKEIIEKNYNRNEKIINFVLQSDCFTADDVNFLSSKAKDWGYDSKLTSRDLIKIDEEYFQVNFFNEYIINGYKVADGKSIKDNIQSIEYVWLAYSLKDKYNIDDKIILDLDEDRELIVAGFCEEDEIVVNSEFMLATEVYLYDDFDSVKTYGEIIKLYDEVTSNDIIKSMGLEQRAKNCGLKIEEYVYSFDLLIGNIISEYHIVKNVLTVVVAIVTAILLAVAAGVIKNYFNIQKEKNFDTLRMYSAPGVKDSALAYMFVMPLIVLSIGVGVVALGISSLICMSIQPTILKFIFENVAIVDLPLFMISPAPFFINILVILLFVTISFVMNFKSVFSKKKALLSEVK